MNDFVMSVIQTPCGKLPKPLETYPSGIGGTTSYGVCRFDGQFRSAPFFTSPDPAEARRVLEEYARRETQ